MRYPPWIALLIGFGGGGLGGLLTHRDAPRTLSPLTAILGGALLGVIAVQILWIRDLFRSDEQRPGTIFFPESVSKSHQNRIAPIQLPPSRWTGARTLAFGLVLLAIYKVFGLLPTSFRVYRFILFVAGIISLCIGLAALICPRVLINTKQSMVWNARTENWPLVFISFLGVGLGIYLWLLLNS
jgi:hypothetical protein